MLQDPSITGKVDVKVIPQYGTVHPYCARLSHHSLGQISNEKKFHQAKLDREINACFFLNKHGYLYFLLHNNSVHIVLLN